MEKFVQPELERKQESRYQLGAVCDESRTYSSEREVSLGNKGIDPTEALYGSEGVQPFMIQQQAEFSQEPTEPDAQLEKKPLQPESGYASIDELMGLKTGQLRAFAKQHALKQTGTRKELASRLKGYVTVKDLYQADAA